MKLVIVGLGGQGVLFLTRVLSETARMLGHSLAGAETHGMSQRGGSVVSHLKVNEHGGPLVRPGTADILLALDPDEAYKALGYLRDGGVGFVNSGRADFPRPEIAARLAERGIELHTLNADAIAMQLGSPALANTVLLGFALGHPAFPFGYEAVEETLTRVSKARFREANLHALAEGYAHFRPGESAGGKGALEHTIQPEGTGEEQ